MIEVHCRRHTLVDGERPPKGVLNWVGQPAPGLEPLRFEARLFDAILRPTATEPTNDRTDDWIQDLNPASLEVVRGSYATPTLATACPGDRFQLERLGYFCVDPDTTVAGHLVLNRTCELRGASERTRRV